MLAEREPATAPLRQESGHPHAYLSREDVFGELFRDLLGPMIETWLDENLRSLVERTLRAEISRQRRLLDDTSEPSFVEAAGWLVRRSPGQP